MISAFVALATLLGWAIGVLTAKLSTRWCPRELCKRPLRCPIHEAEQIRDEQQRADFYVPAVHR